jgi:hypothetical protein
MSESIEQSCMLAEQPGSRMTGAVFAFAGRGSGWQIVGGKRTESN